MTQQSRFAKRISHLFTTDSINVQLRPRRNTHQAIGDINAFLLWHRSHFVAQHWFTHLSMFKLLLNIQKRLAQKDRHAEDITGRHSMEASIAFEHAALSMLSFALTAICYFYSPRKPHYEQGQKGCLSIKTRLHGILHDTHWEWQWAPNSEVSASRSVTTKAL